MSGVRALAKSAFLEDQGLYPLLVCAVSRALAISTGRRAQPVALVANLRARASRMAGPVSLCRRGYSAASPLVWLLLVQGSSPGDVSEAAALVLAIQEFVANGGGRPWSAPPQCCIAGANGQP